MEFYIRHWSINTNAICVLIGYQSSAVCSLVVFDINIFVFKINKIFLYYLIITGEIENSELQSG